MHNLRCKTVNRQQLNNINLYESQLCKSNWLFSLYIRETKQRRNQKSCEKKNNFNFKVIFEEEGGTRE